MIKISKSESGVTLIELLVSVVILGLLMAGVSSVTRAIAQSRDQVAAQNEIARDAHFAVERMATVVSRSPRLLLPFDDSPATGWPEHIREQTVPPSPPNGGSTLATAVLAVTLPDYFDSDYNGIADADNDADGRIDEDPPNDVSNDGAAGLIGIDDDGDGATDETGIPNDDEQGSVADEDAIDAADNDADGQTDEDPGGDLHGDGCPGRCGIDDDGDGITDEGSFGDDDEDGLVHEDWLDPVVYHLINGVLVERLPVPWDTNGDALVTGADFVVSTLAENVSRLRIERVPRGAARAQLVDITLELTGPGGQSISVNRRVRLGAAL